MEIKEAQEKAKKLILHYGEFWPPLSMMARMTEEVGELARAINIKYGEKRSKGDGDGREIEMELVDILFTTLAIAEAQEINLEEVYEKKIETDYKKMKGVHDNNSPEDGLELSDDVIMEIERSKQRPRSEFVSQEDVEAEFLKPTKYKNGDYKK